MIVVADDGPGMTPDRWPTSSSASTGPTPAGRACTVGRGLGLSIVSAIVAAHGGTVSATSAPGRGTTFTVRLPPPAAAVPPAPGPPEASRSATRPAVPLTRPRPPPTRRPGPPAAPEPAPPGTGFTGGAQVAPTGAASRLPKSDPMNRRRPPSPAGRHRRGAPAAGDRDPRLQRGPAAGGQHHRRCAPSSTASFPLATIVTIADNASTDDTWTIATGLAASLPGVQALHLDRKGRGRALRAAWTASRAPVVA